MQELETLDLNLTDFSVTNVEERNLVLTGGREELAYLNEKISSAKVFALHVHKNRWKLLPDMK